MKKLSVNELAYRTKSKMTQVKVDEESEKEDKTLQEKIELIKKLSNLLGCFSKDIDVLERALINTKDYEDIADLATFYISVIIQKSYLINKLNISNDKFRFLSLYKICPKLFG